MREGFWKVIDNNNNGQPAYVIHWKLATATKTAEVKGGYFAQNSVPHRKKVQTGIMIGIPHSTIQGKSLNRR